MTPSPEHDERASTLALSRSRLAAVAWVGPVLLATLALPLVPRIPGTAALVVPASVAGAVAPVIGFRLVQLAGDRARGLSSPAERAAAFVRATVLALAVTAGAALIGLVVSGLSGRVLPLLGVVTHVLLAGAIWPTPERLELFVTRPTEGE